MQGCLWGKRPPKKGKRNPKLGTYGSGDIYLAERAKTVEFFRKKICLVRGGV